MRVTVEWIAAWFGKFNAAYFGGKLPEPRLRISSARTRLGSLGYKVRHKMLRTEFYDYVLSISARYDLPEREHQQTLLHEMIHYYISYNGLRDTSSHGKLFRTIMNELNSRYGWNISVTTKLSAEQRSTAVVKGKAYLVLAVELTDGRRMLTVVNPHFAQALNRRIAVLPEVKAHRWLQSNDEYFALFPAVRSLRGRIVSMDVYNHFASGQANGK